MAKVQDDTITVVHMSKNAKLSKRKKIIRLSIYENTKLSWYHIINLQKCKSTKLAQLRNTKTHNSTNTKQNHKIKLKTTQSV